MSFFVKGAASLEIALTQVLEPSFIAPINPTSIYFKEKDDELVPYQNQPTGDRKKGSGRAITRRLIRLAFSISRLMQGWMMFMESAPYFPLFK